MKWFPNGYGSAKGTSFVIEEIGEVDEDEENYGEYQQETLTGVDASKDRTSIFDEFYTEKKITEKKARVLR